MLLMKKYYMKSIKRYRNKEDYSSAINNSAVIDLSIDDYQYYKENKEIFH